MKIHHCPVEGASITYEGTCNWCSEREFQGLMDQEVLALFNIEGTADTSIDARIYLTAYKKIEAKLREVNT
jgi:hypothetical protein